MLQCRRPLFRAMRRAASISAGQQRGTDTGVPFERAHVFGIDTVVHAPPPTGTEQPPDGVRCHPQTLGSGQNAELGSGQRLNPAHCGTPHLLTLARSRPPAPDRAVLLWITGLAARPLWTTSAGGRDLASVSRCGVPQ